MNHQILLCQILAPRNQFWLILHMTSVMEKKRINQGITVFFIRFFKFYCIFLNHWQITQTNELNNLLRTRLCAPKTGWRSCKDKPTPTLWSLWPATRRTLRTRERWSIRYEEGGAVHPSIRRFRLPFSWRRRRFVFRRRKNTLMKTGSSSWKHPPRPLSMSAIFLWLLVSVLFLL